MIGRYLRLSTAYGFVHSLPHAFYLETPIVGNQTIKARPIDKLGFCIIVSGLAPMLWPTYFCNDASAIKRLILRE